MNYDFIFNRVLHRFPLRLSVRLSLKQIAEHSEILLLSAESQLANMQNTFPNIPYFLSD